VVIRKFLTILGFALVTCALAFSAPNGVAPIATAQAETIGQRVADLGQSYDGQWGGQACIDSGQSSDGYVGGYSGGQCRQFVNCLIYRASGGQYDGAASDYSFPGAYTVDGGAATYGDIIQYGQGDGHTAVILTNYGNGSYHVVDSNYYGDEVVHIHDWTPPYGAEFWRYDQEASG
jgi:hypothetical protein